MSDAVSLALADQPSSPPRHTRVPTHFSSLHICTYSFEDLEKELFQVLSEKWVEDKTTASLVLTLNITALCDGSRLLLAAGALPQFCAALAIGLMTTGAITPRALRDGFFCLGGEKKK